MFIFKTKRKRERERGKSRLCSRKKSWKFLRSPDHIRLPMRGVSIEQNSKKFSSETGLCFRLLTRMNSVTWYNDFRGEVHWIASTEYHARQEKGTLPENTSFLCSDQWHDCTQCFIWLLWTCMLLCLLSSSFLPCLQFVWEVHGAFTYSEHRFIWNSNLVLLLRLCQLMSV